jgi:hypothetical protein
MSRNRLPGIGLFPVEAEILRQRLLKLAQPCQSALAAFATFDPKFARAGDTDFDVITHEGFAHTLAHSDAFWRYSTKVYLLGTIMSTYRIWP